MDKFLLDLITEWRRLDLPFAGETVVTAVSGGADSLALLLALDDLRLRKKLDLRIVAAHFNHRLRGRESDHDEEFVREIARERNFELAVGYGNLEKKGNLEQNARDARYAFLADTSANVHSRFVLTAHTMNDQAETFLLNLIRGSGIDGLAAMRPVRRLGGRGEGETGRRRDWETEGWGEGAMGSFEGRGPSGPLHSSADLLLARPLLRWARREDTENFCRASGVEFRYDTMNEDMSFKRVRVRKMLLPMLKEFNPKIVESLARTAELMAEVPEARAFADPGDASRGLPDQLSISELGALGPEQLHPLLRAWLKKHRGDVRSISLKHIQAIERLIRSPKSGRTVELPGFGLVRRHQGRLSFENTGKNKG